MKKIGDMILQEKKKHWRKVWLAWQIARYTGMRGADILRLRFDNIDFENKVFLFRMPKQRNNFVAIPIRSSLLAILEKLKGHRGLIFDFKDNKFSDQILTKRFGHYIEKLKGSDFKKPGSHTPRHSVNQIMYDNNVFYEHRCYILGQKVPGGAQSKYIHKTKAHIERLHQVIESLPLD